MSTNLGMEKLIPLVNQLQDAFTSAGVNANLDLPQIAVVGSQSVGKSSVLENFVGRDFLPRGSGIVTRRPTVLQLINAKCEYAEFLHQRGKKYTDFDQVRREIEAETDRVTGGNKGISNIPINLKIFSPHVLNLTLVDLPGLTKIAVGDQPQDIEELVRQMIMEYITNDNCLILAVSAANVDLANSDALKLAKEVDPSGTRTIGVITKIDLMDQGSDAREILENKLLPLRRGYIGVVNRSQRDIEGRKDIRKAMEDERQFFSSHPSYSHMAQRLGTPYLQKVLNQQLINHIRETLPSLRNKMQHQLTEISRDLDQYKNIRPNDPTYKTKALMLNAMKFCKEFSKEVDGARRDADTQQLSGGTKINRIFHEMFPYEIAKKEFDEKKLRKEIHTAIKNIHGVRTGLFTPDLAFDEIVRRQIRDLEEPSLKCIDNVSAELMDIVRKCSQQISSFPRLQDSIDRHVSTQVRNQQVRAKDQMKMLIKIQLSYINTNHEDFIGFNNAEKKADAPIKRMGNQIIRTGWLSQPTGGFSKKSEFWYVLKAESLTWYKDEKQTEKKYVLPLEGLKLRDIEGRMFGPKFAISLYQSDNRSNVFKDHKTLDLATGDKATIDSWKAAFLRAGVYPESTQDDGEENNEPKDSMLERQVEIVRNLVSSYMQIIKKEHCDFLPKAVTHCLISKIQSFLDDDLVSVLISNENSDHLMEESMEVIQRREDLFRVRDALKTGLDIISNVSTATITEPTPPPVTNEWKIGSGSGSTNTTNPRQNPPPVQAYSSNGFNQLPDVPNQRINAIVPPKKPQMPRNPSPMGRGPPIIPPNKPPISNINSSPALMLPQPLIPQRPGYSSSPNNSSAPPIPPRPN